MTRLIFAPMVLVLASLLTTAQVKIHVSPSLHKKYEAIYAGVENAGSKPITFCIQIGQTSPKGGGDIEATPSPFLVHVGANQEGAPLTVVVLLTWATPNTLRYWSQVSRWSFLSDWVNLAK